MHQSELQTGQHISIGYACERCALFIYLLLQFVALEKREKLEKEREKEELPCVRYCYPEVMGDQILVWKSVRLFLPDMRCYKFQCPVVIQFLFPLTLFWMIICKDHERLTKFLSLFLQCKMEKISASEILLHKVILKIGIDLGSVRIVPHYILPIRIDATPSGVNLIPLSSRFSDSQGGG